MSLVWREQLSVGNDVIDTDHRNLIDIINRVESSLANKDRVALEMDLADLSRYAQEHFGREEKIAQAAGYPQVPHLGESHSALIKQLDRVKEEIAAMGETWSPSAAEEFTKLLRSWLIDHVIKEDMLMKSTFQKRSPKFDPR